MKRENMKNIEKKLTVSEAYDAMIDYLDKYYNRTHSDDIGSLLTGMLLLANGESADSAALEDWNKSVDKILNQTQHDRPLLKLTK
jgi:hypothetical protein